MSKRLEDLNEKTQVAIRNALKECEAKKIQVVVTYTFRTYEEQAALYAQGRKPLNEVNALREKAGMFPIKEYLGKDKKVHSDNEYIVTNCDGIQIAKGGKGRSAHQLGNAVDVVPDMDESEKEVPGWPIPSDPRWKEISDILKSHGFIWGGDWTKEKDGLDPDYPHYEYKG